MGEFSKLTFVFKGFCYGGLAAAWKPSLIAQLKRDVLWDHFLLHRRSQDWKSTFVFQLQEWINQRKKKVERSRRVFLAVTRNLLNNNCWSPHNFCNQDFFFYVGGCLLLLLLCNLIWHSVLLTMRFWWTYTTIGSAKNATRHGNLFVIQNVNENDISGVVRVNKPKTYTVSKWRFLIVGNQTPKYPAYLTFSRIPPIYSTESVPVVSSVFYVLTGLMCRALINYLQTPSTKIAFTFSRS